MACDGCRRRSFGIPCFCQSWATSTGLSSVAINILHTAGTCRYPVLPGIRYTTSKTSSSPKGRRLFPYSTSFSGLLNTYLSVHLMKKTLRPHFCDDERNNQARGRSTTTPRRQHLRTGTVQDLSRSSIDCVCRSSY